MIIYNSVVTIVSSLWKESFELRRRLISIDKTGNQIVVYQP